MKIEFKMSYIYIAAIIILAVLLSIKSCQHKASEAKLQENEHLLSVLNDSLHKTINKNGEVEYSKKVLQNDIDFLKENVNILTKNQKVLLNEIKDNKNVISAMKADMTILVTNLKTDKYVEINDTTLVFSDSLTNISYKIQVSGIKPSKKPELIIEELKLPNEQTVTFEWEKEKNNPVKVIVKNTNPYVITNDIDGYIIPEITKEAIKPNLWQKTKKVLKSGGGKVGLIVGGIVIGLAVSTLL